MSSIQKARQTVLNAGWREKRGKREWARIIDSQMKSKAKYNRNNMKKTMKNMKKK